MREKKNFEKNISPEELLSAYEQKPVDIAIIGGGPAGISAAINASSRGRSSIILSSDFQNSPLYKAASVENMPGFPQISGAKLLDLFSSHAEQREIPRLRGQVISILPTTLSIPEKETRTPGTDTCTGFQIAFGSHVISARTVILATGIAAAKPFPGEDTFLGKGVSYCATCDGMFYRKKEIAVIALSPDGIEEALHLSNIGCRVAFFARPVDLKNWQNQISAHPFATALPASKFEIRGNDGYVTSLVADQKEYPISGVFIIRAAIAPTTLLTGLQMENGCIAVDKKQATSVPGVFAAGDCTGAPLQIAPALGEGLTAALSADAFLAKL